MRSYTIKDMYGYGDHGEAYYYAEELLTTALLAVSFDANQDNDALFAAGAAAMHLCSADEMDDQEKQAYQMAELDKSEIWSRAAYLIVNKQIRDGLPS